MKIFSCFIHRDKPKKTRDYAENEAVNTLNDNEVRSADFEVDCWIICSSVTKDLVAKKIYRRKTVRITTLNEKQLEGLKHS